MLLARTFLLDKGHHIFRILIDILSWIILYLYYSQASGLRNLIDELKRHLRRSSGLLCLVMNSSQL
jgi:hypothetical protein